VTAYLLAVCVGTGTTGVAGGTRTAIDKRPIAGPGFAQVDGLLGDEQVDRRHHGGPDQALYAYAQEDAEHWAAVLDRPVPSGALGENLRTLGLDVSGARIGEVWRLGACTVQVTAPRTPCRVFAAFWDVADLVPRFLAAGRPGAYLRVLEPGPIQAGDAIELLVRPDGDLTVADVARIRTRDHAEAARLRAMPALSARLRAWADVVAGVPSA